MRSFVGRALTVGLLGAAAWLAHRGGGAADAHVTAPRGAGRVSSDSQTARGGQADEVVTRFVERLAEARIDVPNLKAGEGLLAPHWRKMPVPWTHLTGQAARLALSFALSRDEETEHVTLLTDGTLWTPDVRKWNMNGGSFDQRESIFAPTPATLAWRIAVPPHARLTFSTAVSSPRAVGTTFRMLAGGDGVAARELFARTVQKGEEQTWTDAVVDLAAYAGQSVELVFETKPPPDRPDAVELCLWGDPLLVAREAAKLPYNVLWIVVDAMRADVVPSFHVEAEDAAKRAAAHPPLEALLPKVDGLMPAVDGLASHGVRFLHAWSAATWTRPGTLAMLAGERSSQAGVSTLVWPLEDADIARYYASDPPLLPRLLRKLGAQARAFVNNYFVVGYAQIGVDVGFETIDDERYRTRDTHEITAHATAWLRAHKDERFFVFCNFNSPHGPWEPPQRFLDRIPAPPAGPPGDVPRRYMGEAAKDDEAIGELLLTLDQLGVREGTIVVVTSDHGETLSSAHIGTNALDDVPVQYHHTASDYEETTRIPIVISLPGVLPDGAAVAARVRSTDIAPTVLELEGQEPNPRMTGKSLVGLAEGAHEPEERVVISEGRGMRAILVDHWHYIEREGKAQTVTRKDGTEVVIPEELFDLTADPGERENLARSRPEVAQQLRARLDADRKAPSQAGGQGVGGPPPPQAAVVALRFVSPRPARRVSGVITVGEPGQNVVVSAQPVGAGPSAIKVSGPRIEVALTTRPDAPVGVDLSVDPPGANVAWELSLDDAPWPASRVFAGPFGLAAPALSGGVTTDEARDAAEAPAPPLLVPDVDEGLFVTRSGGAASSVSGRSSAAGAAEMKQLLRDWGYAHGKNK